MEGLSLSSAAPAREAGYGKLVFWIFLGLLALSVLAYTEIYSVLLHGGDFRRHLFGEWFLIGPHALAGTLATIIGPLQFSSRLRRHFMAWHRRLGKVYVLSIVVAAPLGMAMTWLNPQHHFDAHLGTMVLASCWLITTLAAYFTARNRHVQEHREWMVRSYAFTFLFVLPRVPNPVSAYRRLSDGQFAAMMFVLEILAFALPDLAFSWKKITGRKA
jgi:uncharacterized membrane protein